MVQRMAHIELITMVLFEWAVRDPTFSVNLPYQCILTSLNENEIPTEHVVPRALQTENADVMSSAVYVDNPPKSQKTTQATTIQTRDQTGLSRNQAESLILQHWGYIPLSTGSFIHVRTATEFEQVMTEVVLGRYPPGGSRAKGPVIVGMTILGAAPQPHEIDDKCKLRAMYTGRERNQLQNFSTKDHQTMALSAILRIPF